MKLDRLVSSLYNTNIGAVYGNRLKMSTSSRNQSSTMGDEDYFI